MDEGQQTKDGGQKANVNANAPCTTQSPSRTTQQRGPGIIAIDGPAASGKSTVGHAVAERLNYLFFDTGLMYRVVTRVALDRGMDVHDRDAVGALAEELDIALLPAGAAEAPGRYVTVLVDGQDVTDALRTPDVDRHVSVVAANPRVRAALSLHQRRIGQQYASGHAGKAGIVMVGRDIGTVVLPEAPLKIYLDAPVEERARRRHQELLQQGKDVPFEQVLADMQRRDAIDSQRDVAPLRVAEDAHVIQTADLTVEQVVERILEKIED